MLHAKVAYETRLIGSKAEIQIRVTSEITIIKVNNIFLETSRMQ